MNSIIEIDNKNIILIALSLSISVVAVIPFVPLLIGLLIISIAVLIYGKKILILLTILSYLLLTSNNSESIRNYLNIFNLLLLSFLLLNEFGLDYKKLKKLPREIKIFFLIVFISSFLSSIFSEYISISLLTFLQQIVFCFICFVYYSFFQTKQDFFYLIYSIILIAFILGIGIFYQLYSKGITSIVLQSNIIYRPSGLYNNPNAVGLFYVISTPLIFMLFFFKKRLKSIYLLSILFIFSLAVLMLTDSRASMLSVFISLSYMLFVLNRKLFKRVLLAGVILIFILILIPSVQDFFALFFRTNRIFANIREYFHDVAFDIIKNNPIFGAGPGVFKEYLYKYLPVKLGSFEEQQMSWAISGTAHNFFLFRMADLGILGLITAVWLFAIFFNFSNKSIKFFREKDVELYIILITIKSIGLGLLSRAFFESTGLLTHGWITRDLPFWLVFIILISIYQKTLNSKKSLSNIIHGFT